jgi:hypothetical protein
MIRTCLTLLAIVAPSSALTSCALLGIGAEPWERDLHARPSMQFDRLDDDIDDHIYFSKEASSGGRTYGSGGCGCN